MRSLKSIYSEKDTKFCNIYTIVLSYGVPVKSTVEILQNFVEALGGLQATINPSLTKAAFRRARVEGNDRNFFVRMYLKQRGEAKSRQLFRASSVMRNCYFTLELSDEIWGPDALSYDDVQKLVFKYKLCTYISSRKLQPE